MVDYCDLKGISEKLEPTFETLKIPEAHRQYLAQVLLLVNDEEIVRDPANHGRNTSRNYEVGHDRPILPIENNYYVSKIRKKDGAIVDVAWPDIELSVRRYIMALIDKLSFVFRIDNPPQLDYTLDVSMEFVVPGLAEKYFIEVRHQDSIGGHTPKKRIKAKPGRPGDTLSNFALYLLYRYFTRQKVRGIYRKISDLYQSVTQLNKSGAEQSLVMKRIQRTMKDEGFAEAAEKFETRYFCSEG